MRLRTVPQVDPTDRTSLVADRSGGNTPRGLATAPKPPCAHQQQHRKSRPDAMDRFNCVMQHRMRGRLGHSMARMCAGNADEARSDDPSRTRHATRKHATLSQLIGLLEVSVCRILSDRTVGPVTQQLEAKVYQVATRLLKMGTVGLSPTERSQVEAGTSRESTQKRGIHSNSENRSGRRPVGSGRQSRSGGSPLLDLIRAPRDLDSAATKAQRRSGNHQDPCGGTGEIILARASVGIGIPFRIPSTAMFGPTKP